MMRKFFLLLLAVFIIVVIFCLHFLYSPIVKKDLYYVVRADTNARKLTNDLYRLTDLKYPALLRLLIEFHRDDKRLRTGEYFFPRGSNIVQIVSKIVNGKIHYHLFTIVNGYNFSRVFARLESSSFLQHTLKDKSPEEVAKLMRLKHKTPEGLLFPETYYCTRGETDLQTLNRAHQEMLRYLQKKWPQRAKDLPFKTQYTALIVASMIEKEAHIKGEKPIIAGIIEHRLQKWMRLQIDATVIYGMGKKFNGGLTRKDLHTKTPYNTYTNYGLPPTPIAMPGRDSIDAALHPAKTDMLYFVAKKDGSHVFSRDLEQHNKNVEKYQLQEKD
ncbi:MAG: endolytic transglycosylase MltG [Gammaproteobacteria bacterium]|jgi:UPF0755 protein